MARRSKGRKGGGMTTSTGDKVLDLIYAASGIAGKAINNEQVSSVTDRLQGAIRELRTETRKPGGGNRSKVKKAKRKVAKLGNRQAKVLGYSKPPFRLRKSKSKTDQQAAGTAVGIAAVLAIAAALL